MVLEYAFLLVAVNSLVLLVTFVYAYFRPKEWNEWLVTKSLDYTAIYMLTFILIIAFSLVFSESRDVVIPVFAILLVVILWGALKDLEMNGMKSIVPFALYLLLTGQVFYSALTSGDPKNAFSNLAVLYFAGIFFISQIGRLLARILLIMFPRLHKEHLSMMKKCFGPDAPDMITLRDGSTLRSFTGAHDFAGMGMAYCIWLLVSFILLPQPLNPLEWGDLAI